MQAVPFEEGRKAAVIRRRPTIRPTRRLPPDKNSTECQQRGVRGQSVVVVGLSQCTMQGAPSATAVCGVARQPGPEASEDRTKYIEDPSPEGL